MKREDSYFSGNFFRKFKKKSIRIRIIICLFLITLLNIKFFSPLINDCRNLLISMTVSINQAFHFAERKIDKILYLMFYDIDDNLLDLVKENIKLKTKLENISCLKSENDELRKFLHMKPYPNCEIIVARIVSTFSNDYTCSYILDVGSKKRIQLDDVVISPDGLVGRISEINENWSRVLLITDTNSNIPVKIGKNQINAIVSGNNSNILKISMKHEDINLEDGDIVETSNFGNVFCDKIPVGKIVKTKEDFCIVPNVNFNFLKFVCVLRKE